MGKVLYILFCKCGNNKYPNGDCLSHYIHYYYDYYEMRGLN